MEVNSELLKVLSQGGFTLIMFVVWYLTYKGMEKRFTETAEKQNQFTERLFQQMEQDLKYKELLIGLLSKLELKIDSQKKQ
jgi:hypothetical protein